MAPLDALDLPQLYTKPSAEELLRTLSLLTVTTRSWDVQDALEVVEHDPASSSNGTAVLSEGITRYITSIVSSSLKWIDDEDLKEAIWTQASQRLSERSGRTAMGALTRKFRIPSSSGSFELKIHEPALTGDDLGLKTWAASYLLAKRLHTFDLLPSPPLQLRVLELGSGTGLVGLAMAGLGADVTLTDLSAIHENLSRNARDNAEVVDHGGGKVHTGILDWTNPSVCELKNEQMPTSGHEPGMRNFPLILAADSLYSSDHPRLLVNAIEYWLAKDDGAQVIVELPYRTAYLPEINDFRERMTSIGLSIQEQGEEQGYDDWGNSSARGAEDSQSLVTCWWARWRRTTTAEF